MWRVILRISYTSDAGSRLRSNIVPVFSALGLRKTATGTFESPEVDRVHAAEHLTQVLLALADPQQFGDVHAQAVLKHLWLYIDRVSASDEDDTGEE